MIPRRNWREYHKTIAAGWATFLSGLVAAYTSGNNITGSEWAGIVYVTMFTMWGVHSAPKNVENGAS